MKIKKWKMKASCPCGVVLRIEEEDILYEYNHLPQDWKAHEYFVFCPACLTNTKLILNEFRIPPAIKERIKKRVAT